MSRLEVEWFVNKPAQSVFERKTWGNVTREAVIAMASLETKKVFPIRKSAAVIDSSFPWRLGVLTDCFLPELVAS